ncbi:hypothetical protein O181_101915, partial [Austropuccinia psidii MF-1]|nr:hypothetical protein [Austropuccinia psidii MF-1]
MKVFPSAYHHYLDVFSNVKAEKPPTQHACDHHIELEGSLPPVGSVSSTQRGFHHCSNPSLPTIVETDSSDYALGAVLSQNSDLGKHPIEFDRCKLIPAELNYKIHDKELLGIVWALNGWRAFLLSISSPFEFLTNHSSLQYFIYSKVLTCHQPRLAEFLSEFHFPIIYRPDHLATLPDALSFKVESSSNLIDSIQKALWQYFQYRSILEDLGKGKSVQNYSLDSSSKLLLFKDWVVVPNDPTIQLNITIVIPGLEPSKHVRMC